MIVTCDQIPDETVPITQSSRNAHDRNAHDRNALTDRNPRPVPIAQSSRNAYTDRNAHSSCNAVARCEPDAHTVIKDAEQGEIKRPYLFT